MNSNGKFWEIGLKVLAAAVVGFAVFVGIDRSTSKKNSTNFTGPQQNGSDTQNNTWTQPGTEQSQEQQSNNTQQSQENRREVVGEKVVNGLRGMYGTFGKLSQVISSLVDVVGSVGRLFGNDTGYPPRQPYYTNNPWGCGIGPGLHRVNDYIIQVGPTPVGQQCGGNYGYC